MKKWKVLNETDVSPSRWYSVKKQSLELANGNIIDDYYSSYFGKVAMILPFTKDNKIVLVQQYKHGIGEITVELPAGFQQKSKTIEETALAELEEETGIRTSLDNLISLGKVCALPTKTYCETYGFLASNLEFNSIQNFDTTEEIQIIKKQPKEVLKMVLNNEIWVADTVSFILKAQLLYPNLFV